jgi:hypothetical protein
MRWMGGLLGGRLNLLRSFTDARFTCKCSLASRGGACGIALLARTRLSAPRALEALDSEAHIAHPTKNVEASSAQKVPTHATPQGGMAEEKRGGCLLDICEKSRPNTVRSLRSSANV